MCVGEPHAYVHECMSWSCFVHLAELGLLSIPCTRMEGSEFQCQSLAKLWIYITPKHRVSATQALITCTFRISFLKQTLKCWRKYPRICVPLSRCCVSLYLQLRLSVPQPDCSVSGVAFVCFICSGSLFFFHLPAN